MARKLVHHPVIVWPVLIAICFLIFVWVFLRECRDALECAWLASFADIAEYARRISSKDNLK